ncbi:MAG: SufE family protein [Bacteroidales bacterium]
MSIEQEQLAIIEEFSVFTEWLDKYAYLIELGKTLAPYEEKHKVEQNLIEGCQSRVWLNANLIDGKIVYSADSDAIITKGIVALLIRAFSGYTPTEILTANFNFIEQIGLRENLSPIRANGLLNMIKQMKLYAIAFSAQQEKRD